MTAPIQEPSTDRALQGVAYARDQIFRRPGPRTDIAGRFVCLVFTSDETVVVGDEAGAFFLVIPEDLDGFSLSHVAAGVRIPAGSGTVTVPVRNITQAVDMLSTDITIDAGENTSYTAATPPVIDAGNAGVATGEIVVFDVDTTGPTAKGLMGILEFTA